MNPFCSSRDVEVPRHSLARECFSEEVPLPQGYLLITFVPMGPKPHVLAALLVGLRFDQVRCLRVTSRRAFPPDAHPVGTIGVTRVEFR